MPQGLPATLPGALATGLPTAGVPPAPPVAGLPSGSDQGQPVPSTGSSSVGQAMSKSGQAAPHTVPPPPGTPGAPVGGMMPLPRMAAPLAPTSAATAPAPVGTQPPISFAAAPPPPPI